MTKRISSSNRKRVTFWSARLEMNKRMHALESESNRFASSPVRFTWACITGAGSNRVEFESQRRNVQGHTSCRQTDMSAVDIWNKEACLFEPHVRLYEFMTRSFKFRRCVSLLGGQWITCRNRPCRSIADVLIFRLHFRQEQHVGPISVSCIVR